MPASASDRGANRASGPKRSEATLWFNPRCSKCREALELLEARGVKPELRLYLERPPSESELSQLIDLLGEVPLRLKEPEVAVLGLSTALPKDELIRALVNHPSLLERPIFVHGGRAVIGRPPERVLELLE